MTTNFEIITNQEKVAPVVFRSYFNDFRDINANEAWSLFFTAGKKDKLLGLNRGLGILFTMLLFGIPVARIVWSFFVVNK
ncbi:MAG: hypothetical protein ACFBSE_25830 [Prochloraceae cyanobacterium]